MTFADARALAAELAHSASSGDAAGWGAGRSALLSLDGRGWLLLDQSARAFTYSDGTPVSGAGGWLGPAAAEPSGFVATVTSFHVDGRFRERAVRIVGAMPPEIAAPALAVRLLDHVPQVRALARELLQPLLGTETAEVVLDVLLAGQQRQHGGTAVASVLAELRTLIPAEKLAEQLTASPRRNVRRWAFMFGHEHDLLSAGQLIGAASSDPDQWLRAVCADWLMQTPDPHTLTTLLTAKSVEARLVALTRVPETSLSDDALGRLLLDRAPRVREQARWRARRLGWDVVGFYRRVLARDDAVPRAVVASLDGLADTGEEQDLAAAVRRLQHPSPRVRSACVGAIEGLASRADAIDLLAPALADPSARVSATAVRALVRLGAPTSLAEPSWLSALVSVRRSGWRLSRAAGGWHRVAPDVRAAADPDPMLAELGHSGLRNWLALDAATTWNTPSDDQRNRIMSGLESSGLTSEQQRVLAFHAGIKRWGQ